MEQGNPRAATGFLVGLLAAIVLVILLAALVAAGTGGM